MEIRLGRRFPACLLRFNPLVPEIAHPRSDIANPAGSLRGLRNCPGATTNVFGSHVDALSRCRGMADLASPEEIIRRFPTKWRKSQFTIIHLPTGIVYPIAQDVANQEIRSSPARPSHHPRVPVAAFLFFVLSFSAMRVRRSTGSKI